MANVFFVSPNLGPEDRLTAYWHYVLDAVPGVGQAFVDHVSSGGQASVRPLERSLDTPGADASAGTRGEAAPVEEKNSAGAEARGPAAPARAPPGQTPPGCARSRREDRGRPGSGPEDTRAEDPSRLPGGPRCPPARPAAGHPNAGGWEPPPGSPDRARPGQRARPPAGPAGGMGPDVRREARRRSPPAPCP